ncbi:MAG: RNA methyltransferase [Gemmatales bacterium]|nr:RNA methyltransferase [Gemmatales bacterium]MDW8385497.1 RNA methyltransferase [Gemmatales bacterium]
MSREHLQSGNRLELLKQVRVVLVRTEIAGNIGATARVLANFGIRDWCLVAPQADPLAEESVKFAARAQPTLTSVRRCETLTEAVADCLVVCGTTSHETGMIRSTSLGLPWEILPRLLSAAVSGKVALVFGPEADGLSNEDLSLCHHILHIPTDDGYPALNLSHSVAVCLYELRRSLLLNDRLEQPRSDLAAFTEQQRMFEHLEEALTELHFLWKPDADRLMYAIRHLLGRAGLTHQEVQILHGLARQIQWRCRHPNPPYSPPLPSDPASKAMG